MCQSDRMWDLRNPNVVSVGLCFLQCYFGMDRLTNLASIETMETVALLEIVSSFYCSAFALYSTPAFAANFIGLNWSDDSRSREWFFRILKHLSWEQGWHFSLISSFPSTDLTRRTKGNNHGCHYSSSHTGHKQMWNFIHSNICLEERTDVRIIRWLHLGHDGIIMLKV